MIQIEIFGKPIPWTAPRLGKNGFVYDIRYKEKGTIRWQIKSQYNEELILGPVHLDFTFFMAIPKQTSFIKRRQMLTHQLLPMTKPDTTNLQKLYEDCLKGTIINDDNQVTDVTSRKRFGEIPRTVIRLVALNHSRETPEPITPETAQKEKKVCKSNKNSLKVDFSLQSSVPQRNGT